MIRRAVDLPPWLAEALTRSEMGIEKTANTLVTSVTSTMSVQLSSSVNLDKEGSQRAFKPRQKVEQIPREPVFASAAPRGLEMHTFPGSERGSTPKELAHTAFPEPNRRKKHMQSPVACPECGFLFPTPKSVSDESNVIQSQVLRGISSDMKLVNVARHKVVDMRLKLDKEEAKLHQLQQQHGALRSQHTMLVSDHNILKGELAKAKETIETQHRRILSFECLLVSPQDEEAIGRLPGIFPTVSQYADQSCPSCPFSLSPSPQPVSPACSRAGVGGIISEERAINHKIKLCHFHARLDGGNGVENGVGGGGGEGSEARAGEEGGGRGEHAWAGPSPAGRRCTQRELDERLHLSSAYAQLNTNATKQHQALMSKGHSTFEFAPRAPRVPRLQVSAATAIERVIERGEGRGRGERGQDRAPDLDSFLRPVKQVNSKSIQMRPATARILRSQTKP
jgi:hypothetical protein